MVKVFYSDVTGLEFNNGDLKDFCSLRLDYINSITDAFRKKQSVYAWKLLLKSLQLLNIDFSQGFKVNNAKWELINSEYHFSLAHSKNIVTVAISSQSVGVDVELYSEKLINVVRRKFNISAQPNNDKLFGEIWTKNECLIKNPEKNHIFSSIEVKDLNDNKYIIGLLAHQKINVQNIKL